jgi:hypothetical protein
VKEIFTLGRKTKGYVFGYAEPAYMSVWIIEDLKAGLSKQYGAY